MSSVQQAVTKSYSDSFARFSFRDYPRRPDRNLPVSGPFSYGVRNERFQLFYHLCSTGKSLALCWLKLLESQLGDDGSFSYKAYPRGADGVPEIVKALYGAHASVVLRMGAAAVHLSPNLSTMMAIHDWLGDPDLSDSKDSPPLSVAQLNGWVTFAAAATNSWSTTATFPTRR